MSATGADAVVRIAGVTKTFPRGNVTALQDMLKADGSEAGHQKVREFLTTYTNTTARAAMVKWWELGDQFWGFFSGGF